MRRFALLCALFLSFALFACDDDDDNNNNNNNNTNNVNCDCDVTIDTINGQPAAQVLNLIENTDDQDINTPGFQIEVTASFSTDAPCVPEDGSTATLGGGVSNMYATINGGTVTFSGYTIPSGSGMLHLVVSGGSCSSQPKDIQLSTSPIPQCAIIGGITGGTDYSCTTDDEVPGQLGLQRLVTVQCSDVAAGTTIHFLVDGNEQASGQVAVNGEVTAQLTLPVTAICKPYVNVSISGEYDGYTISDAVVTGEACCLGVIPCSMGWTEDTHFVTGTPAAVDTLNLATDDDPGTANYQKQYVITTSSAQVQSVAILVDSGSGTFTEACRADGISTNNVTLNCTIPDGTIDLKPVCYTTGSTEYFEDSSQAHMVYTDTVAPLCASDFACAVTNHHEVDIACSWTIPGVAGTDEDIYDTAIKYTDTYDATAACLADSFDLFNSGWSSLTMAPGIGTLDPQGAPGDVKNHTFTPFVPGPGYCMGEKLIDFAGNESECTSISWTGSVYPNMDTLTGSSNDSQFGTSLASVDLNCDGMKDLVVGAPAGYYDAACAGGWCEGDGKVFVYFGHASGGYSATPDITMEHDPDWGHNTYFTFGNAIAGIGNFTQSNNGACEDLAVGAQYMMNEDAYYTGEVYILKGRTDWTGFEHISTKTTDATSFDMVVKYQRPLSEYSDNWNFYEEFGVRITPIGDFNNDSWGDLAIGAPGAIPSGAIYGLFSRPVAYKDGVNPPVYVTTPAEADFTVLGGSNLSATVAPYVEDYEFLGWSMSALGDINGDNYDDMIIGAPGCGGQWGYGTWGSTTNAPGKAFILMGGPGGTFDTVTYSGTRLYTLTQDTGTILGTQCFGWRVAGFGDFNDDGFLDFGVTDKSYDLPGSSGTDNYEGALFVYFGDGTLGDLTTADAGMKMRSEWEITTSDHFGVSLAPSVETANTPMGDFNNDGIPDILVGAQHFGSWHGSAFVWYGNATLVPNTQPSAWTTYEEATFWFTPPTPNGFWGVTSLWLGDSNNDGYSDIAIGDPIWDGLYGSPSNPYMGRVTVIY